MGCSRDILPFVSSSRWTYLTFIVWLEILGSIIYKSMYINRNFVQFDHQKTDRADIIIIIGPHYLCFNLYFHSSSCILWFTNSFHGALNFCHLIKISFPNNWANKKKLAFPLFYNRMCKISYDFKTNYRPFRILSKMLIESRYKNIPHYMPHINNI